MTTNMRNAVEQTAYEAGRAAAKYEMLVETATHGYEVGILGASSPSVLAAPQPMRVTNTARKAAKYTVAPKAPTVARGAKKAATTRTKGVKEAVINLIASEALAVPDIVSRLGFKEGSIRAVFMGLKKKGRAVRGSLAVTLQNTIKQLALNTVPA